MWIVLTAVQAAPIGRVSSQLLLTVLIIAVLSLLVFSGWIGFRLAKWRDRPLRQLAEVITTLPPDRLGRDGAPQLRNRQAQTAAERVWTVTGELRKQYAEVQAESRTWQRRDAQARALIDLMAQFNQVMQLNGVLERLSHGLSRFFAGDGVAIWLRGPEGDLELAVRSADDFPATLAANDPWVWQVLAQSSSLGRPDWLTDEVPWLAVPLADAGGQQVGIVALTSRKRAAYTVDDRAFLATVVGHAAMALQHATAYEFVEALSRFDALTALSNRREFDRVLPQELMRADRAGQPVTLLMLDIDHFKRVNDERGHQAGDNALRELGRLLQLAPRRTADGAYRIGGEEFAVLLTEIDKDAAVPIADSLRGIIERTRFFGDDGRLTISVGVSSFPTDGVDPASLVRAADRALYEAKTSGRNRVRAA